MPTDRVTSRFANSTPILTAGGQETFGIATKYDFMIRENLNDDQTQVLVVTARQAGRPDLIALDIYGDSNLYWIPLMFNRPDDMFNWPKNGEVIELPTPPTVSAEI
jgi:hypothetical protein